MTVPSEPPKFFKVWLEGYAATGEWAPAQYLGTWSAPTFDAAVRAAADDRGYTTPALDLKRLTYWGCRFYDNERDARATFG